MDGSDAYNDMVSSFFSKLLILREMASFYKVWGTSGVRDAIWNCKDGTRIKLRDMTDKHLTNAINLLERKAPDSEALKYLRHENYYRHEYDALLREIYECERVSRKCL